MTADKRFYFEDIHAGLVLRSNRALRMERERIIEFAREFDPHPAHLSEETAKPTIFGRLCASGWHTASATMRLISETLRIAGGGAGAGIQRLRWIRPVFPDDELHVQIEILATRLSRSRPGAGLVTYHGTALNQRSEPVQEFTATVLVPRRQSPRVDEQR